MLDLRTVHTYESLFYFDVQGVSKLWDSLESVFLK